MCRQTNSSHLSKELDCITPCNSFIVLFNIIYSVFYVYHIYYICIYGSNNVINYVNIFIMRNREVLK